MAETGLLPVPDEQLHCTLVHAVGLTTNHADVDAILNSAATALSTQSPFEITFDRPSVSAVAVEIAGHPGAPFHALADALTAATARGGMSRAAPSRYPHIATAYAGPEAETLDPGLIKGRLSEIDRPLSGTVCVTEVHLVEQWHDGRSLTWNRLARLPLGPSAPTAATGPIKQNAT
ncbi:2'-5' RNA ligase family protein [Streptomyces sp. NPDC001255]|uniref:2'-5' RNA ligase family protein n=1 Tax=Streptomyces sp. NPDC001255 TaxID=3364550 RepID=UPI0036932E36